LGDFHVPTPFSHCLRYYLEDCPLEVQVADGPAAACQQIGRQPFHAVLCDLVMPGGGGLEVLRFVQSQEAPMPVIIIIIAGYGDEESAEACARAGAFDFVSKPVEPRTSFFPKTSPI